MKMKRKIAMLLVFALTITMMAGTPVVAKSNAESTTYFQKLQSLSNLGDAKVDATINVEAKNQQMYIGGVAMLIFADFITDQEKFMKEL